MAKLNLGVIGLGRMGRFYAGVVAGRVEGARLVAVADLDRGLAEKTAGAFDGVKARGEAREVIDDPAIHAVIIATPTHTHAEIVKAAAAAKKAIFCEKPMALTLAETDAMAAAAARAGVPLQIGFMRRFDRGYAEARRRIEAGEIGAPVMVRSIGRDPFRTSLEYANPEVSGGLLIDMAIHDFDLCRWLMGDEVERVYAEGGALVYPELAGAGDLDNAMAVLRFSRGGLGNVEVSRNARYGYDIQGEILGSEGALRIGYLRETPLLILDRKGAHHDVVHYFPERFGTAYAAQIEHFIRCIGKGETPAVGAAEARAALQISLAATRSLREGRVVRVAEAD